MSEYFYKIAMRQLQCNIHCANHRNPTLYPECEFCVDQIAWSVYDHARSDELDSVEERETNEA